MRARRTILATAFVLLGAAVAYAQSPFLGTWKLNDAKSKIAKGAAVATTVTYEAAGENTKVTVDGTDASGGPMHYEWTGKFDGKAYPITGSSLADSASYRKITSRSVAFVQTKGGKVVIRGRIVVAPDGKTRRVTTSQPGANGKRIYVTAVYDKQ